MGFPERLKEIREANHLTQEELAKKAGIKHGTLRNWEQGIGEPKWSAIEKLSVALGVSCEVFRVGRSTNEGESSGK